MHVFVEYSFNLTAVPPTPPRPRVLATLRCRYSGVARLHAWLARCGVLRASAPPAVPPPYHLSDMLFDDTNRSAGRCQCRWRRRAAGAAEAPAARAAGADQRRARPAGSWFTYITSRDL
jgi:hypothetical protein